MLPTESIDNHYLSEEIHSKMCAFDYAEWRLT